MNGSIAVSLFCDIILLNTVDIERNASLEGVYFTHIIGHTHKPVSCQSVRFNQQFMNDLCLYKSNIFILFTHNIQYNPASKHGLNSSCHKSTSYLMLFLQ